MENPLEQPVPEDLLTKVHTFARDYAYGVVNEWWDSNFHQSQSGIHRHWGFYVEGNGGEEIKQFQNKWTEKNGTFFQLLRDFGYSSSNGKGNYRITPHAIQLLEKPLEIPNIFISYRRKESSALALLVEARLKLADSMIGVFVDKNIPTQTRWDKHLKEQVENAKIMICLIAPETLESKFVQSEILQAINTNTKIISILHLGYTFPHEKNGQSDDEWKIIEELKSWQSITVEEPISAEKYEIAISRMLNDMGYSTY